MNEWKLRRFWKTALANETESGFEVRLDDRVLKTPAKAALTLPTRALAEAIAVEWNDQTDGVDPQAMPMTRTANSAVDKVSPQREAVADLVAEYGESDLLCYRAATPVALRKRQDAAWDPLLQWATEAFDAPLVATEGIIHVPQNGASLKALKARVHALTPFQLAALHDLVALSGSLIIGFAATLRPEDRDQLWQHARIDEHWQQEHWGIDEEAQATERLRADAFRSAARFYDLCRGR